MDLHQHVLRIRTYFALAVVTAAMTGCGASRERVPTPSVALYVAKADSPSAGQGVWVGERVLSARHVLASEHGELPERLQIDDQLAGIEVIASGDVGVLRQREAGNSFLRRQEDWIVASVAGRSARVTPAVLPGDGTVRPGEQLYMVGYDIQSGGGGTHAVPLRVPRSVDSDVAVPARVTLAILPRVDDWRGWSGSFVGRYIEKGDGGQWEFVGIASSVMMDAKERTQLLAVVRPPEDVVRAFFAGAAEDVPVLVGMPGPLALPPGYRATSSVAAAIEDTNGQAFTIEVCVATNESMPQRVLVSIGGCDAKSAWTRVEPEESTAEPPKGDVP